MSDKVSISVLSIFLAVGVLLEIVSVPLGVATGVLLALLFSYLSYLLWTTKRAFVAIVVITLVIEAIGHATGVPFGAYYYTESVALGALFGVPLFIPLAWYVLLSAARQISSSWWHTVVLIITIDVVLELFATAAGLWLWAEHSGPYTAPIANYISWGILAWIGYYLIPKRDQLHNSSVWILGLLVSYMTIVYLLSIL